MHESARSPTPAAAAAAAAAEVQKSRASGGADAEPSQAEAAQAQEQPPQQQQQQQQTRPAAAPSSGVRRSSTGGSTADAPDPAAFYANKLQAAAMGSSGGEVKQQQQQQQSTVLPVVSDTAAAAPNELVFEPMAGRVLLLGRKSRRLSSAEEVERIREERRQSSSSGGQHSSSLAGRVGVQNLSRLGGASMVASLPTQPQQQQSSTPQGPPRRVPNPSLWQTVFGMGSGTQSPQSAAAAAAAASDVISAPDGLPRIRTRPLGEAREEAPYSRSSSTSSSTAQPVAEGSETAAAAAAAAAAGQLQRQPSLPQQQQGLLRAGSLLLRGSRLGSGTPGSILGGSSRSVQRHGPLYTVGSGPISPSILSRMGAASGAGTQLRSLEADREAIAAGRVLVKPDASSAGEGAGNRPSSSSGGGNAGQATQLLRWDSATGAGGAGGGGGGVGGGGGAGGGEGREAGMRLCVRWLDELVVALWVSDGGLHGGVDRGLMLFSLCTLPPLPQPTLGRPTQTDSPHSTTSARTSNGAAWINRSERREVCVVAGFVGGLCGCSSPVGDPPFLAVATSPTLPTLKSQPLSTTTTQA